MKLTQGILPSSKFKEGPDNPITSNPDAHEGFEIGTWDTLPMALNFPYQKGAGYDVVAMHYFSKEDCQRMIQILDQCEAEPHIFNEKGEEGILLHTKPLPIGMYEGYPISLEWFKRLHQLFSNTEDLPVYYLAD